MRFAILSLLLAAGAFRLVTPPVDETEAGPPIEIRLDGGGDAALERKIEGILDRYPAMKRHRTTRFELLSDLPDDAERIRVVEFEPNLPVIILTLHGEVDERVLKSAMRTIIDDLESLRGMGSL